MRGIQEQKEKIGKRHGIIPAHAGNTPVLIF